MKISTKGRYAIKLMLDLALYSKGQPVKIKEIAKRQGISEKYLEQIVATLNKAALVKSIRGSHAEKLYCGTHSADYGGKSIPDRLCWCQWLAL